MSAPLDTAAAGRVSRLLDRRLRAGEAFFGAEADRIARLCHVMAERFARGGRLLAIGAGAAARSDARHVAVEFVHPVIVGKRALPALALTGEGASLETRARQLAGPKDIAIGFGEDRETASALAAAGESGSLTIAFTPVRAEWVFTLPEAGTPVRQELAETLYHLLWEHVHVFFDHRGLLEGRTERARHDSGAASFLYPFLEEAETDLEAVLGDVRASVAMKAAEVAELRTQTLTEAAPALAAAAAELAARSGRGGTVLALGNGGSATDAMDAVADLRTPPGDVGWLAHPALDLTEDPSILTAIANDVGIDAVFARQVIAHGGPDDALLAFSTSGGSGNVISALAEARRRGLVTVAFVGYDGGRIAEEGLADHVVVSRSQHIPRIQEAQASAWHVLRELMA